MYLVINLGLKSLRCIIFDKAGKTVYSISEIVDTTIKNNFVEQNPASYKKILNNLLKKLSKLDVCYKINYISVTTSANCLLGVSKDLKPVTKVSTVLDFRANDTTFKKILLKKKCFIDPSHNISKIIWYKHQNKKLFNKTKYWINNSDYISYLITGELISDPLNLSKFYIGNLKNTFKILNKFKIKDINFPKEKAIGYQLPISKSLITKYKFNKKCKFILTTYDAICACIGSVNKKNLYNNACEVSGTVTSFRYLSKKKPLNKKKLKVSHIPLIDHYIIGLSNNLGGGIIEWYKAFFRSRNYYASLEKSYNKGNNYFYFFPFIFGDRDMGFRETSRGIFFGLGSNTNIHDMTKSVVDASCFVSRNLFDRLNSIKKNFTSITLSGGLARLKFINILKSNLFGLKVFTCKNFESTALGCLVLMLVSSKKIKFKNAVEIINLEEVKKNNIYKSTIRKKYNFFKTFIINNKKIFNIKDETLIKKNHHIRNL